MSFQDLPDLDSALINAIEEGNLLLFIGAGVSALYGYPVWNELARDLTKTCLDRKKITRSQMEILLSSSFDAMDAMKRVTIACQRLGKDESREKIVEILGKKIGNRELRKAKEISKYLGAYNCPVITTNADVSLDELEPFKRRLKLDSLLEWKDDYRYLSLIHLHGSINNPDTLIFTSDKYAEAYRAGDEFGQKLHEVLNGNKTILFIGYGMGEFELIKYFISDVSENQSTRFFLNGYLKKDEYEIEFDREFYTSLGIKLIPYSREEQGYDALISVLKKWDRIIKNETMVHRRIPNIIQEVCQKEPNEERIHLLEGLLNEQEQ